MGEATCIIYGIAGREKQTLVLGGDDMADSPGHTAKFGSCRLGKL